MDERTTMQMLMYGADRTGLRSALMSYTHEIGAGLISDDEIADGLDEISARLRSGKLAPVRQVETGKEKSCGS
jgi:hypothetical protein